MQLFFKHFTYVKAAGGIVEKDGKCLLIKRNRKWDIPKGKMENDEKAKQTAVREIQEECGLVGELEVTRKITKTYHTYFLYDTNCLKKTKWFVLHYSGEMNVAPQTEEGITEVVWVEKEKLVELLPEMYSSVRDVVACYLNS